jgi:hypothetical protein
VSLFITEENTQEAPQMKKSLSEKVSLYRGDITLLEVDAIVNAGEWFTLLDFLCCALQS